MKGKDNLKTGRISARVDQKTEEFFRENKLKGSGAVSSLVLESFPHCVMLNMFQVG